MNASSGWEAAVTATARVGWMKFREYGELLSGQRFILQFKEKFIKVV